MEFLSEFLFLVCVCVCARLIRIRIRWHSLKCSLISSVWGLDVFPFLPVNHPGHASEVPTSHLLCTPTSRHLSHYLIHANSLRSLISGARLWWPWWWVFVRDCVPTALLPLPGFDDSFWLLFLFGWDSECSVLVCPTLIMTTALLKHTVHSPTALREQSLDRSLIQTRTHGVRETETSNAHLFYHKQPRSFCIHTPSSTYPVCLRTVLRTDLSGSLWNLLCFIV